jgi:hypothetical protein
MTSKRKLPDGAYAALAGLKGQAVAASLVIKAFNEGISEAEAKAKLWEAQKQMAQHADWTKLIVRKILSPANNTTIDDIDESWLDKTFA